MIATAGSPPLPTPVWLKDKRVGVLQGSIQETDANMYWKSQGVAMVPCQSQDQRYADLGTGRSDAALQDKLQADYGFLHMPRGAGFAWVDPE